MRISDWRSDVCSSDLHAFDCYVSHFETGVHVNEDINIVLDQIDAGEREPIPDHDLLVGGFPCQDYSVAKTLNQAHGIERSEERRVGKGCGSTCRYRWSP